MSEYIVPGRRPGMNTLLRQQYALNMINTELTQQNDLLTEADQILKKSVFTDSDIRRIKALVSLSVIANHGMTLQINQLEA